MEEKTRWDTELSLATEIQMGELPEPITGQSEFSLSANMTPAKEVGGDFYDFFMIDEDHLGIVIADVSGKGVPAALFMMVSKLHIRNYAMMGLSPGETIRRANDRICESNSGLMFVTVWFGVFDLNTGHVEAVNAGHEYPFIRRAGQSFEVFKDPHTMMVGAFADSEYEAYSFDLEPGDTLFVYTDGAPEATNASKEFFGMERLGAALKAASDDDPADIIEKIRGDIADFVGDSPRFDDLTMLCLRFQGRN